jgi:hypothetical protein
MADKDVLADAKERFRLAHDAEAENRKWAIDDLMFARMGEQWPLHVRKQRELEGRPCLTINRMPAFARQVVNDARQNKPAIRVRPADSEADPDTANIYNGLIRNIEQSSNADVAYDTALESAVYTGFGYFRLSTDYAHEDTFDLDIKIERIANPLTVYADPTSTAPDASDWRFGFVTDLMPLTEFESKYGKNTLASNWSADGDDRDSLWRNEDSVRIAEYWTRDEYMKAIVQLSNGQVLDAKLYEANKPLWDAQQLTVIGERETRCYRVRQQIVTGAEVLETVDWPGKYIPIIPVFGDEVNVQGKRYFRSLVRDARDSQMMFNFWRTASTELVALAPKAPFIGPRGAFDGDPKWQSANVKSHPYLEYEGAVPPQRQPFAGVPAGALQEALNSSDDMKAILGIYDASLGARSNETSGRAILARQREGDVSTFHFIDNLSRAIKYAGRCLIDLIPAVYNTERMVRVLGEDGDVKNVLVNPKQAAEYGKVYELARGKYDLVVEAGPSFSTKRDETQNFLLETMRANPSTAPLLMDVLARNMDFPEAEKIAARFKTMLPPAIQKMEEQGEDVTEQTLMAQLSQAQMQMQQMQQALQSAEMQKAQLESQKVQQDGQIEAQKLQLQKSIEDQRAELERYKANLDAQVRVYVEQLKAGTQESSQQRQFDVENKRLVAQQLGTDLGTVDALIQTTQEITAGMQAMQSSLSQQVSGLASVATAPKRVVRDQNDKVVGVESVMPPMPEMMPAESMRPPVIADASPGGLVQSMADVASGMREMQSSMSEMMAGLAAAMAAPKRVVRDPKTNKVAGVEPVLPASQ